jgi:hypothetical protein
MRESIPCKAEPDPFLGIFSFIFHNLLELTTVTILLVKMGRLRLRGLSDLFKVM